MDDQLKTFDIYVPGTVTFVASADRDSAFCTAKHFITSAACNVTSGIVTDCWEQTAKWEQFFRFRNHSMYTIEHRDTTNMFNWHTLQHLVFDLDAVFVNMHTIRIKGELSKLFRRHMQGLIIMEEEKLPLPQILCVVRIEK